MDPRCRDERFMRRALDLAPGGLARVEPNPMVGAVVVQGDRVVGEGFHARFSGAHAEVVALAQAGTEARGAELFVTLEPCCHRGKTPPCTDAILAAGVRRVVAAVGDPFPEVRGRGLAILKQAGLEVEVGVLETEARRLNAAYFKRQATGLPLVIAKWAMTLDGRLATAAGESRWISSEAARRRVHELRRIVDAVLVGARTARMDEPSLTVRHVEPLAERGQPARVILDAGLSLDPDREPVRSAAEVPVLIYTTDDGLRNESERAAALRRAGAVLVAAPKAPGGVSPDAVLRDLGARGMSRVLVEGGARILGSFFAAGLVDRVLVFVSPRILGSAGALSPVGGPGSAGASRRDAEATPGAPGLTLAEAVAVQDATFSQAGPDLVIEGRVGEF
ncbi:MAG: bifunctional diaminohydroxyphosphoribosylaminopyrimidine deaminase/5-amino-6-(5-phosphoribosylamino)uracil reductase RibD [Planctomycetota bacterium]|nr:bifunctional diaminohydroxyphosphoribosylaminopyrimidine deaminase/5-amino-6-(5-phosphoribosylamino)uracil reductase RibD [Planctomycetota bacterium]